MKMPEPSEIKDRVVNLLKEQNISQSQFLRDHNLNPMTIQHMATFYPRLDTIAIIAEALEVSVDSLISGPSENESAFIFMLNFCRLHERDQKVIMTTIREMLGSQ